MNKVINQIEETRCNDKTYKTVYLPGLNGLRAIAAIAVIVSHSTLGLNEFGLDNKILGTDIEGNANGLSLAGHGVTVFFTLSGFLITFLLLTEKEVTGQLKIKDFYMRRVLRIWPLYYLYFAVCIVTMILCKISFPKTSIPYFIFLAANIPFIAETYLPFLSHYWSIGVEEQFYIFFPHLAKLTNKRLLRVALVMILSLLFLKFIFWFIYRQYDIKIPYIAINVIRFHTMLVGVIGAILYYYRSTRFLEIVTHKFSQTMAWTCIILIAINKFHIASVIDAEIVSIIALILIVGQVTKRNNLINLENKVFDFLGKISFGMYIIHPIIIYFLYVLIGHLADTLINYVIIYFLILGSTIILAFISYEFYEKPFLKLKSKYSNIKSSNSFKT